MSRSFINSPYTLGNEPWVSGGNGTYIVKSLWIWEEEALTLCDGRGMSYRCVLLQTKSSRTQVRVLEQTKNISEPSIFATVYQSLPKTDEMDSVVQKAVECGTYRVVPVLGARYVSRPDEKAMRKKTGRWQKVALEAAKQFDRGVVPEAAGITLHAKVVEQTAVGDGRLLFFYEGGGQSLRSLGLESEERISLFIGLGGGSTQDEVELARQNGAQVATLGLWIFRTETAPVAALSVLMMLTGSMEQDAVREE